MSASKSSTVIAVMSQFDDLLYSSVETLAMNEYKKVLVPILVELVTLGPGNKQHPSHNQAMESLISICLCLNLDNPMDDSIKKDGYLYLKAITHFAVIFIKGKDHIYKLEERHPGAMEIKLLSTILKTIAGYSRLQLKEIKTNGRLADINLYYQYTYEQLEEFKKNDQLLDFQALYDIFELLMSTFNNTCQMPQLITDMALCIMNVFELGLTVYVNRIPLPWEVSPNKCLLAVEQVLFELFLAQNRDNIIDEEFEEYVEHQPPLYLELIRIYDGHFNFSFEIMERLDCYRIYDLWRDCIFKK